ncbi:MAG: transglutaminase domain-containing protein [Anaerolineales bacterium]|nr:transglutaminase domain-containing protein [Anaerolineales bacterium]
MKSRLDFREGWLILGLILAMAMIPAVAMRWADWVPGLWVLQTISVAAVLAGFFLAKSHFSSPTALLISIVYGLFTVGLFSGILLPDRLDWHEKIPQLIIRQTEWMVKASHVFIDRDAADTSRDGLIFIMQTGIILWILGFSSAWYTFRRLSIWRVILPNAILLLLTLVNYYGRQPMEVVLVVFLVVTLLYIISSNYLVNETRWKSTGVVYSKETRLDFLQTGFIIVLLIMPIAWLVPNASAEGLLREYTAPIDNAWQRVQDGWTQLFASLRSYGGEYADPYGGTLTLGGPRQIEPIPVMDVKTNGGRYWRGVTYDTYNGGGWTSTEEMQLVVVPDQPLSVQRYIQQQIITATFTTYMANTGLLYFPHQPIGTDRQAKIGVIDMDNGQYEITSALNRYILYEGQMYKTWGSASQANDQGLRSATTDYPQWVKDRFLQLPSDTSPRIVELAGAITAPYQSPYDKAEALTQWLRTNMTYNDAIQAPPPDVDPLEYFLFETKEGYCNYYATALAVMLRTQNIPSRLIAGYARGTWQQDLDAYRVYSDNAHSWVEVYFPRFGWVEFEPTTSEPEIIRTAAKDSGEGEGLSAEDDDTLMESRDRMFDEGITDEWPAEEEPGGFDFNSAGGVALIIGGAVLLLTLIVGSSVMILDKQNARGISVVAHFYNRLNHFARWIGVKLFPFQTPHERAASLAAAAPDASAPIDVITDLYVEEQFGQVPAGTFDERAGAAWRELRPTMLRYITLHALLRFRKNQNERTEQNRPNTRTRNFR